MENASKALIIAGAILISILLISVAIMVISSTQGVQDQMGQQMDSTEKSTFNAQFTNYAGTNRSSSQVKSLFEKVTASNASNPNQVNMYVPSGNTYAKATAALIASIDTKSKYYIYIKDAAGSDGIYDLIVVSKSALADDAIKAY